MRLRSAVLVSLVVLCGLVIVFEVATVFLAQNRLVSQAPLASRGPEISTPAVVDGGMRAMAVRINDVLGVAGFVLPGERVDIVLTRSNFTDILLRNVKILAIGQSADKLSLAKTATVEVNTVDAQKLTLAQTVGTLSLALRAGGSVDSAAPRRITMGDLGPAYDIYAPELKSENATSRMICATTKPQHPFAGRHPCFPE